MAKALVAARRAGGRLHVTGIGKSAHVAAYAASLFASTGTPATFLHGTEATHGSVGQVAAGDVVLALSNSGTTDLVVAAARACKALGAQVIGITSNPDSPLAQESDEALIVAVPSEGGPLGLAPRASVLAQAVALMALSVSLQLACDLDRAGYNARHPGGALGRASEGPDPS